MRRYIPRYGFVATTILSSVATFIKSFFFMDILSKGELGKLALFQSVIIFVTFLQIGILHGGYRLISLSILRQKRVNNAVATYLFILFFLLLICFLIARFLFNIDWIWLIGVFIGLASLFSGWNSNMHIALGRTNKISLITLCSIILSLCLIPSLYALSFYGAVLVIALQPVLISLFSYIFNKDFNLKISFNNKFKLYFYYCIKIGFIPFITSVLHYINLQIERWIIGADLGIVELGNYYLVFVYVSFFSLIPGAIGTLNFPKLMKLIAPNNNIKKKLIREFKFYYLELVSFLVLMFFATFYLLPIIVDELIPQFSSGVQYVYIVFYGLVFFTLIDPISFIINAKLHYRELVQIYIFSVLMSIICYWYIYSNGIGSLLNYSYVNLVFYISISLGYVIYYFFKGKKSLNFDNIKITQR